MSETSISNEDLPVLFRLADDASASAQQSFTLCMAFDLSLIVVSAIIGAFSFSSEEYKVALALSSAGSMAAGLLLTLYIRSQRFEQDWYDGRAIAESVKTRAWRFMTCSEPYLNELGEEAACSLFLQTLKEVTEERKRFAASIGANRDLEPNISEKMLSVRRADLSTRKEIYLSQRIDNQRKWYSNKSTDNKNFAGRWFNAVMAAQAIALLSSLALIHWPEFPVNIAGIFAALAAAFIAWMQLKRHQELANSYGLAAQELDYIAEQARHISAPEKLSSFILDAENAISREHTLWRARRDTV